MSKNTPFGIIFSIIVSLIFVIAIIGWFNLYKTEKISVKQIKKNEITTYLNLIKIANAQQKYIKEDWNSDGKHVYSIFLAHLWKTIISKNGDTKLLKFIPKELGFASEPSFAVNGYYFMVLHYHVLPDKPLKRIDYTKEWAVFASPLERNRTGQLGFLIDQTGNILVSLTQSIYNNEYPYQPLLNGWKLISTLNELNDFQKNTQYIIQQ